MIKKCYCKSCEHETTSKLVRNVTASGISQVWYQCIFCLGNVEGVGSAFVKHTELKSKNIEINLLPIINDYRDSNRVCFVCGERDCELHHYAPRHLFTNADSWPTGYLCKKHHDQWHKIVTPNMCLKGNRRDKV